MARLGHTRHVYVAFLRVQQKQLSHGPLGLGHPPGRIDDDLRLARPVRLTYQDAHPGVTIVVALSS